MLSDEDGVWIRQPGTGNGDPYRNLCPRCYNRDYMQRAGLPELAVSEFDPVSRFDAVGGMRYPPRPNTVWWLQKEAGDEENEQQHD